MSSNTHSEWIGQLCNHVLLNDVSERIFSIREKVMVTLAGKKGTKSRVSKIILLLSSAA